MMNAQTLTIALHGRWHGRYGAAPCPVCQPERRRDQDALTLSDGAKGLLLHCKKTGCDFRDIAAASGIAPGTFTAPDPAILSRREAERKVEADIRANQAQRLWDEALPIKGTIAETYLRGRGITCDLPETLRFAPSCWHATAHALWKGERDRILQAAKKGKGEKCTAAQADLAALGAEPAAPPSSDRTVTEPTFEGLTRLFATGQPSLGLFSDEGGQFLGGFAMNGDNRQKTLAALNDLWQGKPIRRTRAGEGHTTLYGRRLDVNKMFCVFPSIRPKIPMT